MTAKVPTLSDLIHRVASSSCLSNPLTNCRRQITYGQGGEISSDGDDEEALREDQAAEGSDTDEDSSSSKTTADEESEGKGEPKPDGLAKELRELAMMMEEVFDAVAAVKRAYVDLQAAHCPWDPTRMRSADESVVAELRRLGRLRDRYRRVRSVGLVGESAVDLRHPPHCTRPLQEAVLPYEAALEDARREIKLREAEVEGLKERLRLATASCGRRGKKRTPTRKGRGMMPGGGAIVVAGGGPDSGLPVTPTSELFSSCADQVKSASRGFTTQLLSLMRTAHCDVAAAVQSILQVAAGAGEGGPMAATTLSLPTVGAHHAKHALESYLNRRIFQGFEHESFYMEGSLSSLLDPAQHRRECYSQYRGMIHMDPAELLGVLPSCPFGRWAARKYLATVSGEMEATLSPGTEAVEQRRSVAAGAGDAGKGIYGKFLVFAKAVWMLHLLAFSLDPAPGHFEAEAGAEFVPAYMDSVVQLPGGRVPDGWVVGFSVTPGFKLGNGSVIRARVYPVPRG